MAELVYNVGDVITLENNAGDRLVREVIANEWGMSIVPADSYGNLSFAIDVLVEDGWRVTSVKPKPAPLPGEPPRFTEFFGYSAEVSQPNSFPQWGRLTADFADRVQERFMRWLVARESDVKQAAYREVAEKLREYHHLPGTNAGSEYAGRIAREFGVES